MKRQLSLGMLFARSFLWRVLGILAVMAAAQGALGYWTMTRFAEATGGQWQALEEVIDGGWFRLLSALALTGIVAVVMLSAGGFGSRSDYTAARLPVPRWTVYAWSVGCTLGALLLFWAVQAAVLLGLTRWYVGAAPAGEFNPQLMLLTTYRSSLFHTVLPLRDKARWVATALYFLGLGVVAGTWAVRSFGGKWSVVPLILAAAWWFPAGAVGSSGWAILLAVISLCWAFGSLMKQWEVDRE